MIVVSNTTPINYLVLTGHIDILRELFSQVIIPEAVWKELHDPRTPETVRLWADSTPAWLEVRAVTQTLIASVGKLGAGEREAIALAKELNADAILMDDRKGTKEAQRNGLTTVGTLAIIAKATELGLLDLTSTLSALAQTNFRFPPVEVIEGLLQVHEQTKRETTDED
jgi:predicted nucleic acid-binding protein